MAARTLAEYYASKGQRLPSLAERAPLATQYGIQNYAGTAAQNTLLLQKLLAGGNPSPAPAAPPAPAPDPYAASANAAGQAGLSVGDTAALFGATPEEEKAKKDELAKTFGYGSFEDFTTEVFSKPSKTTEQYYKEAYSTAGLDQIRKNIEKRRADLAKAEYAINDNPWLSEASRRGNVGRLQELANAEIANWEDDYRLGLDQVKNLIAAYADDLGSNEKMREARLNYLLKAAEEATSNTGRERLRTNLSSYLSGKQSSEKPDTISIGEGSAVYRWNPTTRAFEHVITRPKTYAPKRTTTPEPTEITIEDATSEMTAILGQRVGQDGFVSPSDYRTARNAWIEQGLNPTKFDTAMRDFRNPKDKYGLTKN